MNLLSKTLGLGLAVAVTFAGCAAAATLAFGSTALSAGNATTTSCGVSSLAATRTVDNAGSVARVDVGSIPLACSGETLSVTLVGAAGASLGSGTGVIGGCTTRCSVSITASVTNFGVGVAATNVLSFSFAAVGA
jgi:hypothetical protein